jgi:LysM domain
MAIAPLLDTDTADWPDDLFDARWLRPPLRLVPEEGSPLPGGEPAPPADPPPAALGRRPVPTSGPAPTARVAPDVSVRRGRHAAARRRRRALVLATVAGGLVAALALPLGGLGGAAEVPHPGSAAGAGGAVYVVRPGDTLWSIAASVDHGGDPRALAEAIARETGSSVVVPGERIAIP